MCQAQCLSVSFVPTRFEDAASIAIGMRKRKRAAAVSCADELDALPRPSHAHIERALAAVADMRVLDAQHVDAEFRQRQPEWHLPLEHAATASPIAGATALAGDHQHGAGAVMLRAL